MVEAGHRCAIPTCRAVAPLQIEHIDDWAKVREHRFENMIVLCANCHGLKGNGARRLDRSALRQYKANLATINNRYGDLERQLLEWFAAHRSQHTTSLARGMAWAVWHLERDGLIEIIYSRPLGEGMFGSCDFVVDEVHLTPDGIDIVRRLIEAEPLD